MQAQTEYVNKTLFSLPFTLPLVILFEGFVSIAVEILTIRQLLPVAGGSIIVTSLIIGVFLLFLALGYQHGGRSQVNPQKKLAKNFLLAAGWISLGLSYFFIDLFFYIIQKITGPSIVLPLLAYLLLITAPLIYILGQTVPMTMNMIKQETSVGQIGGNVLGLSTIGSFLGAVITTILLMQYFGVAYTVLFVVSTLLFTAFLLAEVRKNFAMQFSAALFIFCLCYVINVSIEKHFFVLTDNYANYQIQQRNADEKILIVNDTMSSAINAKKQGFKYIEIIKKILFSDLNLHQEKILVLGAGGFTLSAEKTQHNQFTYVDIDKNIPRVVFPHFINKSNDTFVADDARHYLQTTPKLYDVIVSDTYSDPKAIPANLLTQEYFYALKKRLAINGVAIFNIIANPTLQDSYSKGIDNTIRSIFNNCMAIPVVYADKVTNIIYACYNNQTNDKHLYTDNLNHSTTDSFSW